MSLNVSTAETPTETILKDDAVWILSNAFRILTMQTGFGLLECGSVSSKNAANIMVKNLVDVSVGGFAFWLFGFALGFGQPSNSFFGYGSFLARTDNMSIMGTYYTHYVYQFSFASTATTIVSGAVAGRMKLSAYILFSFFNLFVYCIPASWVRNQGVGFLNKMGFFDFAGSATVHLNGGVSAFVACVLIGARRQRFEKPERFHMYSPVTALAGMFVLCWTWLAFNCGSTYGINGYLWKISAKVAVTTLNGGIGGGMMGLLLNRLICKDVKYNIAWIITSVLGGLVGITASCSIIDPLYALGLGMFCGTCAIFAIPILEKLKIDDPVSAIPVHCVCGFIGTAAVGLIGRNDEAEQLGTLNGLVHGGGFLLFGIQCLGIVCISTWSALVTLGIAFLIDKAIGLRFSPEEEAMGADFAEHGVKPETLPQRIELAWENEIERAELEKVMIKIIADVARKHPDLLTKCLQSALIDDYFPTSENGHELNNVNNEETAICERSRKTRSTTASEFGIRMCRLLLRNRSSNRPSQLSNMEHNVPLQNMSPIT